jgi:hypothetical protein
MHHLQQVFGIATAVNMASYVDRGGLDDQLAYLLEADRHIAIHGDSKQGKSWLRSRLVPTDSALLVQCTVDTDAAAILAMGLGQLGISAELKRTESNDLEGHLDLSVKGGVGAKILAKLGAEVGVGGSVSKATETESQPVGRTPGDLSWVARVLVASEMRLVVEDFHYLSETQQAAFAYMLKALGEYGVHPIIVGIWPQDHHLLVYYNGDLEGRVEDLHLHWSDEELGQVLDLGGKALNVEFSPALRSALIADAYGNVGLLQRLAERICIHKNIVSTVGSLRRLEVDDSLVAARRSVADGMRGRFQAFADNFVRGMRRMPEGLEVYKHLLQTVTESDDALLLDGIDSADLLSRIAQHDEAGIRASDLTQALDRIDRLQSKIAIHPPVLTYNRHSRKVFLGDRSFLFYRKYGAPDWPWDRPSEPITNDLAKYEPLTFADLD